MRAYELMVIFNPTVDERTVGPSMEKLLSNVTEAGGTVENVDIWGKRRLAYEIEKQSEGIYVVVNMTTTPDVAQEINRLLSLNETVMRTKLLRPEA
ncbi:MAG: 30S ribosomal protein S6 [Actinomycetaceae bacterium]|nr:30S ribosomal protein S6 [Actinomycetaceae bacterium]